MKPGAVPAPSRRLADTPEAVTTTFTYESVFSQVTGITDPLTHATTLTYDARGNLLSMTDANSNRRTMTSDALAARGETH